jgi:hypothetical protein
MSADEEPSKAAGACVLVALGSAGLAAIWAASPEAGILTVWTVGTVALWRTARRTTSVDDAATPSPPPPSGQADEEFAQVIEAARREGAEVTEIATGTVIISTPDDTNPARTRLRFLDRPERA